MAFKRQSELEVAAKSARETVSRMMHASGCGTYVSFVDGAVDYTEVIQAALLAAHDERVRLGDERVGTRETS